MATPGPYQQVGTAASKSSLSTRAANNSLHTLPWDAIERMSENLWRPDHPDGLVFLGVAENSVLQEDIATYMMNNLSINPSHHLGYGVGPRGSPRLKKALTSFFNQYFGAQKPVIESEVIMFPGVAAVIDALTWSICNDDEGIIVPVPFYTGFKPATQERSRGVLIPAHFRSNEGDGTLDDVFDPEMNKRALECALLKATETGVKVRAVMLSNPHNPLGRCYPKETLQEIARFCGHHNLHLISDEVFAMSVYCSREDKNLAPFTSILQLDLTDYIDPQFVHIAYGMGKDFCATGLRLGALHSRNKALVAAVSSICVFGWVPYLIQDIWAQMLEDESFVSTFVKKNQKMLATHCTILTTFLDQQKIPYYENVNAGVFIWVDLRRYLYDASLWDRMTGNSTSILQSSDIEMYQDRESKLFKRCFDHGVGISMGSTFGTEELGWFRISFMVHEQALYTGLQRLMQCLLEFEGHAWH